MANVDTLRPMVYHLNWVLAQENADMAVRSEIESYFVTKLFGELLLGTMTDAAQDQELRVSVAAFILKEVVMQLRRNFKSFHTNVINSSVRILRGLFGHVSTASLDNMAGNTTALSEQVEAAKVSLWGRYLDELVSSGKLGGGGDGEAAGEADATMCEEERTESICVFRDATVAPNNVVIVTLFLDWLRQRADAKRNARAEAVAESTAPSSISSSSSPSFEAFLVSRLELVQLPEDSKSKFSLEMRARVLHRHHNQAQDTLQPSPSSRNANSDQEQEHTSYFSMLHLDMAAAFLPHSKATGRALKVDADEELFEGLVHMQKARRGRALVRLADVIT